MSDSPVGGGVTGPDARTWTITVCKHLPKPELEADVSFPCADCEQITVVPVGSERAGVIEENAEREDLLCKHAQEADDAAVFEKALLFIFAREGYGMEPGEQPNELRAAAEVLRQRGWVTSNYNEVQKDAADWLARGLDGEER